MSDQPINGNLIRSIRNRKNWSASDLSEKSGVSVPYIYKIENGEAVPSVAILRKLSEALDVSLLELMTNGVEGEVAAADVTLKMYNDVFIDDDQRRALVVMGCLRRTMEESQIKTIYESFAKMATGKLEIKISDYARISTDNKEDKEAILMAFFLMSARHEIIDE